MAEIPVLRFQLAKRLAGEFAVIVIGVLVALGIDAWWSEQQERMDEREAIQLLRAEFASNAARLDTVASQHREGLEAGYSLLGLMDKKEQGRETYSLRLSSTTSQRSGRMTR